MKIEVPAREIGSDKLCPESMKVCLVAGRNLQQARFDFEEPLRKKPTSYRGLDPAPANEKRPAVGMAIGSPPGGKLRHAYKLRVKHRVAALGGN
jgi:hypothetical protein